MKVKSEYAKRIRGGLVSELKLSPAWQTGFDPNKDVYLVVERVGKKVCEPVGGDDVSVKASCTNNGDGTMSLKFENKDSDDNRVKNVTLADNIPYGDKFEEAYTNAIDEIFKYYPTLATETVTAGSSSPFDKIFFGCSNGSDKSATDGYYAENFIVCNIDEDITTKIGEIDLGKLQDIDNLKLQAYNLPPKNLLRRQKKQRHQANKYYLYTC